MIIASDVQYHKCSWLSFCLIPRSCLHLTVHNFVFSRHIFLRGAQHSLHTPQADQSAARPTQRQQQQQSYPDPHSDRQKNNRSRDKITWEPRQKKCKSRKVYHPRQSASKPKHHRAATLGCKENQRRRTAGDERQRQADRRTDRTPRPDANPPLEFLLVPLRICPWPTRPGFLGNHTSTRKKHRKESAETDSKKIAAGHPHAIAEGPSPRGLAY